jgi:hypothetical protein
MLYTPIGMAKRVNQTSPTSSEAGWFRMRKKVYLKTILDQCSLAKVQSLKTWMNVSSWVLHLFQTLDLEISLCGSKDRVGIELCRESQIIWFTFFSNCKLPNPTSRNYWHIIVTLHIKQPLKIISLNSMPCLRSPNIYCQMCNTVVH